MSEQPISATPELVLQTLQQNHPAWFDQCIAEAAAMAAYQENAALRARIAELEAAQTGDDDDTSGHIESSATE
jgi:hypothetical protein